MMKRLEVVRHFLLSILLYDKNDLKKTKQIALSRFEKLAQFSSRRFSKTRTLLTQKFGFQNFALNNAFSRFEISHYYIWLIVPLLLFLKLI